MSLLALHCFAQLAAEQIRRGAALICSPGAVLANGWAGKKLHLRLKLEKAAGKGCPEPRDPTVPPPWGMRGSSFPFFGVLFPMDLWDLCCSHHCLLPWCLDTMPRGMETKPISSHFQCFWGAGMRMAPLQGCALPASSSPLLVSPTASSVGINPGKAVDPSLWAVPREGLDGAQGEMLLVSINKCKNQERNIIK